MLKDKKIKIGRYTIQVWNAGEKIAIFEGEDPRDFENAVSFETGELFLITEALKGLVKEDVKN